MALQLGSPAANGVLKLADDRTAAGSRQPTATIGRGLPLDRSTVTSPRSRRTGAASRHLRVEAAKGTAKVSGKAKKANAAAPPPQNVTVVETEEENSRVRLTVTVPESVCKKAWDKTIRDITNASQLNGFRKGDRVPEYLLLRHAGESNVKRQVLEELLQSTLPQALDSVAGRALKDSEHIQQKADDLIDAFSPTASFQYDVTVDVIPSVKWASERAYANMEVEVEVDDEEAMENEVERTIRSRHKDLGKLKVSGDSGLKMGDVTVVDISAFRIKDDGSLGDPILSATQKGFQVDTEEGLRGLLPGFVDALIGLERGQSRDFDLVFPDSWQQESLRGVPARFTAVCQEIFERELPPLTDDIADKFVPGAKTMDEVRERIGKAWRADYERKKKQATMLALVDAVGKVCDVAVPNSLLEEQGRQMYGAKLIELQAGGKLSKESTEQLMSEAMVNNYLTTQRVTIEKQVKQALAVQEVFRLENLSYTQEELDAEAASAEMEFKQYGQEYDAKRVKEQAAELLEGAKVLEWLMENSNITYVTKPASA